MTDNSEKSITVGIARRAKELGVTHNSTERELQEAAKKYAKAKTTYAVRDQDLSLSDAREMFLSESRRAYAQMVEFRSLLEDDHKARKLISKNRRRRKKVSGTALREANYKTLRVAERRIFTTASKIMASSLLCGLVLITTLVLSYTSLGDFVRPEENDMTRNMTLTVYSRSSQINAVTVGRADNSADIEMKRVQVVNDKQFNITVDHVRRGESVAVTVQGEGIVGCKVMMSRNIVISNRANSKEVTCKASW